MIEKETCNFCDGKGVILQGMYISDCEKCNGNGYLLINSQNDEKIVSNDAVTLKRKGRIKHEKTNE